MTQTNSDAAAEKESAKAVILMEDLHDGMIDEEDFEKTAARTEEIFQAVLTYYRGKGDNRNVATHLKHLGFLARHAHEDNDRAKKYFLEAADLFAKLNDRRTRLACLMEIAEIDSTDDLAGAAAAGALEAGLPEDLHYTEDPHRLAIAKREAGNITGAVELYEALIDDALAHDRKGRAAMLLRDVARIYEDDKKDKARATDELVRALAFAEEANDKQETADALLRLTDIYVERGKRKMALQYFEQVEKMRGLAHYQRASIPLMRAYFDGK